MEAFPSESESTVADALLLLCSPRSSSSSSSRRALSDESAGDWKNKEDLKSVQDLSPPSDYSKSCCSTLTSSDGSTGESLRVEKLQALSLAARFHDLKLKVVRRSRSNHNSGKQNKFNSFIGKWSRSAISSTALSAMHRSEFSSPVSSASSSVYGDPSRRPSFDHQYRKRSLVIHDSNGRELKKQRIVFGSPSIKRRAEDILRLLSCGWSSEVRIRKVLGDRPDTSKALRMLLKQEQVKRYGAGGRRDPYMYMVVGSHSTVELP